MAEFRDHNIDIEFMQPIIAASRRKEAKFAPILLFTCSLFVVCFIIWARIAEVDQVTRGEGKVIPSSQIQKISHLEGGIIEELNVKEGDIVEKGAILLKIDNTIAGARAQEGRDLYYQYLTAVARLKAQISGTPFEVPQIVQDKAPEVARQEMIRYQARQHKLTNEKQIVQNELEQKKQELIDLQGQKDELTNQYRLSKEELDINAPLAEKGLISKVDFLRLERENGEIKGKLTSIITNISKAESAVKETEGKLSQVSITSRSEDFQELRETEARLASAHGSYTAEGDRLTRTEVRSPVKGIIKQLMISTVGGIVRPGEDILELVPLDDTLLIEAQIQPSEIAFLRPGLPATVKLTAYDYSIYGGLKAELIEISPDAIEDKNKQNKLFFRVRLRTLGNRLSKSKKDLAISPGMTASVDVLTGKKTVWDYLMKPILKVRDNALTER